MMWSSLPGNLWHSKMSDEHWNLKAHVRGALSEALVAEAVHQRFSDAVLHSPRHPGYDVESVRGDLRVDAKVACILETDLDGSGQVSAIEWDAGGRADVLHPSATHLGLVALDDELTSLNLGDGTTTILRGDVAVHGRVFLVPRNLACEESIPIWSGRNARPSKGRFRYLRLRTVEPHEVDFRIR